MLDQFLQDRTNVDGVITLNTPITVPNIPELPTDLATKEYLELGGAGSSASGAIQTVYTPTGLTGKPWVDRLPSSGLGVAFTYVGETTMPAARYGFSSVVTANRLFVFGGWDANGVAQSTVFSAEILTDGNVGVWTTVNPLPVGLAETEAVITGGYVYVIGGSTDTVDVDTTYKAVINQNGTLGPWTAGSILPETLSSTQAVSTGSYIYLIGGWSGPEFANNKTFYAPINVDGTLGVWTAGDLLPRTCNIDVVFSVKKNANWYVFAGGNDIVAIPVTSGLQRAQVQPDGTLGAWTDTMDASMQIQGGAVVSDQTSVLYLGGYDHAYTDVPRTGVYSGVISLFDLTVDPWNAIGNIQIPSGDFQAVMTAGHLILIGGYRDTGPMNKTYSYTMSGGGRNNYVSDVSQVDTTATLVKTDGTPAMTGKLVLSLNGTATDNSLTPLSVVETAIAGTPENTCGPSGVKTAVGLTVNYDMRFVKTGMLVKKHASVTPVGYLHANGAVVSEVDYPCLVRKLYTPNAYRSGQPWFIQTGHNNAAALNYTAVEWGVEQPLPVVSSDGCAFVTKNAIYYLGGADSFGTVNMNVYRSVIDSTGTMGGWSVVDVLTIPFVYTNKFIHGNYLYVFGDPFDFNSTFIPVYRAAISAEGTIGKFYYVSAVPAPLVSSAVVVLNGKIHVIGGMDNYSLTPGAVASVYTADIDLHGEIGTWSLSGSLPDVYTYAAVAATSSKVYVFGGLDAGGVSTNVAYSAAINVDGSLGTWNSFVLPIADLYGPQAVVTDNQLLIVGGSDSAVLTYDKSYSFDIGVDGNVLWETIRENHMPTGVGFFSAAQLVCTSSKVYAIGGYDNNIGEANDKVVSLPFNGGSDDYIQPLTTGTGGSTATLPDYTAEDASTPGVYTYIKI